MGFVLGQSSKTSDSTTGKFVLGSTKTQPEPTAPVVAETPTTKTPIDQRIPLLKTGNKTIGDFWLGNNLIPAYKEDSALAKLGKGAVNLIGGTAANIFGAPQQSIMQADRAAANAITGKPQDFSEMTFGKDILGAKKDNLLTTGIGMALDPTTYIGGGILDDMARAGQFGKGATLGTAENLAVNAATGQRATKGMAPSAQQATREYLNLERNIAKRVETPDVIYGQPTGASRPLALPPAPKQEPFKQVNYSTMRKPVGDYVPPVDNPLLASVRSNLGITAPGELARQTGADAINLARKTLDLNKTKQAGEGVSNVKTLKLPQKQQTLFTENNIDRPFVSIKGEATTKQQATAQMPKQELPKPSNKVVLESTKEKPTFMNALKTFYRRVVDTQSPISRLSKEAGDNTSILASNSRNSGGTVDYILKDGLVDRAGGKIGASLKEVAEKIPIGKEQDFWDYMSQRHNIDRAREGKNVIGNYTSEMSQQATQTIEKANPAFKSVGDEITSWIDNFMQEWGVKAGTVDKDIYNQLRKTYKSYFPTQREFSQLEKSMPEGFSKKFVDQSSPIKKATGSERDINNPIENIMNLVNRTVKTARYNEVGQSLLDSVRKQPGKLKQFAEVVDFPSNVDNVVTVMENGKPVYLQINNRELLDSLNGLPKIINNMKAMRAVSNVFKGLITQKNPLFAIRNIARDIPTAYIYGSEHNPLKFGANLVRAGKEIITNGETYQKYRAVGGGQSGFFAPSKAAQAASELTKPGFHPLKAIEGLNALTETAPRLAEFSRILDKTGDVQKALDAANNITVNFARGGDYTKMAEPLVPYLNAGVQGIDRFFKAFKDPKTAIATLIKAGVAITLPDIALYLVNKDNPNYQELEDRIKDTYFLIPNGDTFIKIPKSRELGVLFGSLFERIMRSANGEEEAFKGFFAQDGNPFRGTVATNFSPANPLESNILSPYFNLRRNKDFADRPIVPQGMVMDKRSPYLQYDEKTSEIAKFIGDYSRKVVNGGLSPKQIDYLIKSYTGVIGQIGIPATTKGGDPLGAITNSFTVDPLYSSKSVTKFYDNLDKLQRKATDRNVIEKIPSKALTPEERFKNRFLKASEEISKINKQIKALDQVKDEARIRELKKRIQDIAKINNDFLN